MASGTEDVALSTSTSLRSAGHQDRSRQRQQAILDAAEGVIGEVGLDGLSMREVGRRAGLPIASLYHYFPSGAAIVRELASRQLQRIGDIVRSSFAGRFGNAAAITADGFGEVAGDAIATVAGHLASSPAASAIWHALRSNPELRALDRRDTESNAGELAVYLRCLTHDASEERVAVLASVILEAVAVNIMFAMESTPIRRAEHLDALRRFVAAALRGLR